jgi:hypothetical protein
MGDRVLEESGGTVYTPVRKMKNQEKNQDFAQSRA